MMAGDVRFKCVIFILVFLVAGSQPQENVTIPKSLDAIRQLQNHNSSVTVVVPPPPQLNSSAILNANNATNSTQPRSEPKSPPNLELLHILKERVRFYFAEKQSLISSVTIISLATVSVVLYLMLVSWRRHLQKIYGNRECLVQNEVPNERNSPYV